MFKANKGVSYTAREGRRQQDCKWTQAPEELGILQKDKLGEKFPTFVPNPWNSAFISDLSYQDCFNLILNVITGLFYPSNVVVRVFIKEKKKKEKARDKHCKNIVKPKNMLPMRIDILVRIEHWEKKISE